jgi:benzoate/toluate 1,2-dioxygenase reductase component
MTVIPQAETHSDTASQAPTHQVALRFEDGVTRFVTCRDDQTVAGASYRQRINIPVDCLDGVCGTCKAFCESGSYDGGSYLPDALSDDEAAAGNCLPCVMKPRSDLVLQIRSTSEVAKTQAASYTGTVVELSQLSSTTVRIAIDIPNRAELTFLPGQYVNIAVPDASPTETVTRSYSFSNAPHEERLTFLIKTAAGGVMSTYLTERAAVGDALTFTGPHGSFFLRESDQPVLMLAGGTGLAPILSMLRTLRAEGSRRRGHVIYGVNTDEDLVALDLLADITAGLPGFGWDHCVVDPASNAVNKGPEKAYVTSLISPAHLYDGDVAIYLCGPPPMVEAVRGYVGASGVEPAGLYYEKFALAVPAAKEGAKEDAKEEAPAVVSEPVAPAQLDELLPASDARAAIGQAMLPAAEIDGWTGSVSVSAEGDLARRIVGQLIAPVTRDAGAVAPLDSEAGVSIAAGARSVIGQEMFPVVSAPPIARAAAVTPITPPVTMVAADGYQIGEDHPEIHESDALFEAREALELGALELTLGRLSNQQLTGYRLLAEATLPYVAGDRFVDAAQYTETNAAFHDYLFTLTGNQHLLQAYQALGVKGRMTEALSNATWCHPLCAQDHVDIVDAFAAGDRDAARALIIAHADRSKQTMRRAMADALAARRPRFVTPGRFAGKVVLVTGAAQGIGEHTARRIGAEGGMLVLADRSELVAELAAELTSGGQQALAVTVDLEQAEGAHGLVQQALTRFGRIDVLINNVGGAINFKPFTEFTDAEIRAEVDRSLMTTLYACRAALPPMVQRGRGVIVNVSSAATRGIRRIPYSAAKGGINAITASLALEYADAGIRVVATAPGGTQAPPRRISRGTPEPATDAERAWFQDHIDQTIGSSLMKRYGTLDEQAAAICFLASDEASYITGTVLPVAGGDQG